MESNVIHREVYIYREREIERKEGEYCVMYCIVHVEGYDE